MTDAIEFDVETKQRCVLVVEVGGFSRRDATPEDLRAAGYVPISTTESIGRRIEQREWNELVSERDTALQRVRELEAELASYRHRLNYQVENSGRIQAERDDLRQKLEQAEREIAERVNAAEKSRIDEIANTLGYGQNATARPRSWVTVIGRVEETKKLADGYNRYQSLMADRKIESDKNIREMLRDYGESVRAWDETDAVVGKVLSDAKKKLTAAEMRIAELERDNLQPHSTDARRVVVARQLWVQTLEGLRAAEKRATEAERTLNSVATAMGLEHPSERAIIGRIAELLQRENPCEQAPSHPFEAPSVAESKPTLEERVTRLEQLLSSRES